MDGENVAVNGRPGGPPQPPSSCGPLLDQQTTNYTIPGILHFIKHEWSRFEKEKANWEVERAELQAKIAFLQGEKSGHENLMRDLVRRIKMLEYALKQERSKFHKLKHGTDLVFADAKPPVTEPNTAVDMTSVTNQKEESRKILREYLREVGFPDNVLEARVDRISAYKSLYTYNQLEQSMSQDESLNHPLPPLNPPPSLPPHPPLVNGPVANGTDTQAQPSSPSKREASPSHPLEPTGPPLEQQIRDNEGPQDGMITEDNALASFNFLNDEDEDSDEEEEEWEETSSSSSQLTKEFLCLDPESDARSEDSSGVELDLHAESAMDEFCSPGSSGIESGSEGGKPSDQQDEWSAELYVQKYTQHKPNKKKKITARPGRREMERMEQFKNQADDQPASRSTANPPFGGLGGIGMMRLPGRVRSGDTEGLGLPLPGRGRVSDERIEVSLLGDLAGLSISNENVGGFDNPSTETVKKWDNKFTMRSHFDAVTSVAFHPSDHTLVTGSDDCTLKVWNLQKQQTRRTAIVDVEPLHTFRGHRGSVLSVAVGASGEICFSGSTDTTIRVWQLPSDLGDPFDVYDPEVHRGVLQGHTDAIWGLAVHSSGLLLSCGADGTCRLWNHQLTSPQVKLFRPEPGFGNPTSVDFVATDVHQMVASYTAAKTVVYDLETAKPVLNLDSASTYDGTPNTQINKVVCHPTLPIIVTGHEDKYIRFYDANTGKAIHSMTAHMDAVTGLAVDPHGLYLLSGSHDGSLRFWNMDSKICIQETTAHRKRFDESIYNVACHLTKPYFASAGADGIAKIFV